MNNNSSGFVKATARLLVALLAVCLTLTALPLLTPAALPAAQAANIEYIVPAGTSVDTINTQLAGYASGSVVDVVLNGNIDFKSKAFDANEQVTGIVIPSGLTVNLYMSGNSLTYIKGSKAEGASWQQQGVMGIVNNGTLNIYSGSSATSPNNSSGSLISVVNVYENMEAAENEEKAYSRCDAIVNKGALTVNKGVQLNAKSSLKYSKNNMYCAGSTLSTATGIYNATAGASCTLNSATITVTALSQSFPAEVWTLAKTRADAWGISYGVYGGDVNVTGTTSISTEGTTSAYREGGDYSHECEQLCVAYDICTSGKIRIDGGTFNYSTNSTYEKKCSEDGKQLLLTGNILTTSSNTPVITDGDFNVATVSQFGNVNHPTYREGNIASTATLPLSGAEYMANDNIRDAMKKSGSNGSAYPNTTISGATYVNEIGNTYTGVVVSDKNQHPTAITRGAPAGKVRIHIIYRYWVNRNRSTPYFVEDSSGEMVCYSFDPEHDGTGIVTSKLVLNNVDSKTLTANANTTISFKSGADVNNPYYWEKRCLATATGSANFSDFKPTSAANTIFENFDGKGGSYSVGTSPVYIFCDYYLKDAAMIEASIGSSNSVTLTYTGSQIKPSACGLQIFEGYENPTNVTAEYNIDRSDSGLIPVSYSWERTDSAGAGITGANSMPEDVGTYSVTVRIADDSTYDPYDHDPGIHKNRKGIDGDLVYSFNLTIVPANVKIGSLPAEVTLTYGQTLSEVLNLSSYKAAGLNSKTPTGSFVYVTPGEGAAIKSAGTSTVKIKWVAGAVSGGSQNYKDTEFTVTYTVNQKALTVSPMAAAVGYGESEFKTPFDLVYDGLIPSDDLDSVKSAIKSVITFNILMGDYYREYAPGTCTAGSYPIAIRLDNTVAYPAVLNNYELKLDNSKNAQLTVSKAALHITATAVSRPYAPGDNTVTVKFDITSGKYYLDSISIASVTGSLDDNHAGTRAVSLLTQPVVEGAKQASYYIASVDFATGVTLTAEITKAVPNVSAPPQKSGNYRCTATLNLAYSLEAETASIAGHWEWVKGNEVPTVSKQIYNAKFVPDDKDNYSEKEADVKIVISPTPVTISFNGSVEYGDPIPTITSLDYKSVIDPDFDINKVDPVGNIIPSTNYTQGSPVNPDGYPVEFSVNGFADTAGNYIFDAQPGKIIVAPRTIEFTVDPVHITYGDSFNADASTVTLRYDEKRLVGDDTIKSITKDGAEPVFSFVCPYNVNDPVNNGAGIYAIEIHSNFPTSANYTVTYKTGSLYVDKAPLTIQGADITLTYNSDIPTLDSGMYTLIGSKNSDTPESILADCDLRINPSYVKGTPVAAESYPVNITLDISKVANYNVTVKPGSITVVKATPVIIAAPTATIVYGEKLADAVFAGGTVADNVKGSFRFEDQEAAPGYKSTPYNYSAIFIPEDSVNYNPVTGLYVQLTVNKKPIEGDLAVTGNPMIGATGNDNYLRADASGLTPSDTGCYVFKWYIGDNEIGTGIELKLEESYKAQQIKLVAVAQEPYIGSKEYLTTQIAPYLEHDIRDVINTEKYTTLFALGGLDAFGERTEKTYSAADYVVSFEKLSNVSLTNEIGEITVKYNGSEIAPKKVGTYKVTVDVATPSLDRLNDPSVTVYSPGVNIEIGTLVIKPAEYQVEIKIADKVYDGSNEARILSVTPLNEIKIAGVADRVAFDTAKASFVFADDANAGSDKVVTGEGFLTGENKDNYTLVITNKEALTANILPRELDVTAVPVARAYEKGRKDVLVAFTVDKTTLAPTDTVDEVYVDQTNATGTAASDGAGTRQVTLNPGVALAGAKAANYTMNIVNRDSASVVIEKAIPSYPMPELETVEFDAGRTLADVDLGDSRWSWKAESANVIPQAGKHTYTAVFVPEDTKNYTTVEKEMTFEVTPKTVFVEAASFTVVYGSKEPYYSYTIDGLTGTDSQKDLSGYVIPSCAYTAGSDVGKYAVVLSGSFNNDNYIFLNRNGAVDVIPKTVYVDAIPVNREYAPGNKNVEVEFSEITGVNTGDEGSVYIVEKSVTGTVANDAAGIKLVNFTLPALTGPKYKDYTLKLLNSEVKVEILKAHVQGVTLPKTGTVKFGQRLSSTVFDAGYVGTDKGTFAMENKNSTPSGVGTFANQYKVVFTPKDTVNYATESAYITLTVERADLHVEMNILGTPEIDKKLVLSTTGVPADAAPYIVYKWYRLDNPNDEVRTGVPVDSGTSEYTVKEADAGKYIACVADNTSASPYVISGRAVTAASVVKPVTSLWQKIVSWFYRLIAAITQLFGGMQ